ncbi:MAG: hypothetical protein ABI330_22175 [Caldimonas sp.]
MAIRPQQMHPALVRLPLTLLPLTVAADLAGKSATTRSSATSDRRPSVWPHSARSLPLPAGSSPGGVNAERESRDMLMTHRNLNFVATVVATSMAVWRSGQRRPNALYLGAGLAGVGVVAYTVYLRGKLLRDGGRRPHARRAAHD